MAAIFKDQATNLLGVFSSQSAVMTLGEVALGIVQNVQLQHSQQINRIYDVGNGGKAKLENFAAVYYVGGRAQGQGTIARVLGPGSEPAAQFYAKFGGVCESKGNNLTFTFSGSTCGPGVVAPTTKYTAQGAIITNVGISVAAQDMIVNENVTFMFANLDVV